jgi:hypothetical protein
MEERMKDRIEGTIKITPGQVKELLREHIESVIKVPADFVVDITVSRLNDYSSSEVSFVIRHEDDKEDAE